MSISDALGYAASFLSEGGLERQLRARVAIASESQPDPENPELERYLTQEIIPHLQRLDFECKIMAPPTRGCPILVAIRHESDDYPTVLTYGHGDVVPGNAQHWSDDLSPWDLTIKDRRWYGRGTADNKGQHTINLAALESVIRARNGQLGFNVKVLFETGEECGSPGLREFCQQNKELLRADLFLASDGPRLNADRPTLFLGSRGNALFTLSLQSRDQGLHSGNWGGVMTNPAIVMANAIASLVDGNGKIQCEGLRPPAIPESVSSAIANLNVTKNSLGRELNPYWGEPGLTLGDKLFGWNTFEVLAIASGDALKPINAIPPRAVAYCQLRFVVGTDWEKIESSIRLHLDSAGFEDVSVKLTRVSPATRLDPNSFWPTWAENIISKATDKKTAVIPNLAGTLPNDIFANVLDLPTLWIPHSYPGCAQHAPNEHMLEDCIEEGLKIMTHVFWGLGELER